MASSSSIPIHLELLYLLEKIRVGKTVTANIPSMIKVDNTETKIIGNFFLFFTILLFLFRFIFLYCFEMVLKSLSYHDHGLIVSSKFLKRSIVRDNWDCFCCLIINWNNETLVHLIRFRI